MPRDASAITPRSDARATNAAKGTISYTIAGLLGRGIGFLMLPLYTRVLTPADYGRLTVVTSIGAMTTIILMLGLDSPTIRIYFEFSGKPERQDTLVQSLWRFLILSSSIVSISLGVTALAILGPTTNSTLNGPDVLLGMVATGLGVAGTGITLPALRAGERFRGYLIIMAVSALATAGAAAILVLVLRAGVAGALIAGIIANLIVLAVAYRVVPWRRSSKTDRSLIARALRMGIPLVPHFASMQALILADRLILLRLVSASELGIFGLASNLALPAIVACQAITTATMPTYARVGIRPDDGGRRTLSSLVTMQVAAVTAVTTATALLGPPLVRIVASADFAEAAPLVGWIALGYGFLGLYGIPMNGATIGAGRTGRAWIASLIGATSNLLLIILLTPAIGIEGAAIASAGGYLVLLLGIAIWAHLGPNPVSYDLPRTGGIIAIGAATFAVGTLPDLDGSVATLLFRLVMVGTLCPLLVAVSGSFSSVKVLLSHWRRPVKSSAGADEEGAVKG